MRVRILGCGTSSGVPRIGNDWGACDPAEPRNRRRRVSILVEHDGVRVLVDTGPDLREQLLDAEVGDLDAVIWTHDHADHCHGVDDLRAIYQRRRATIRGFARTETLASLRARFGYIFDGNGGYPPVVNAAELPDHFRVGEINVHVVDQPHGSIRSAGLLFTVGGKSVGYSTDCSALTGDMRELFGGTDVWIVDALRREPHASHPHLEQALAWIAEVHPGRAILTHMDQSMDYRSLLAELPTGVEPGYDGLEIEW